MACHAFNFFFSFFLLQCTQPLQIPPFYSMNDNKFRFIFPTIFRFFFHFKRMKHGMCAWEHWKRSSFIVVMLHMLQKLFWTKKYIDDRTICLWRQNIFIFFLFLSPSRPRREFPCSSYKIDRRFFFCPDAESTLARKKLNYGKYFTCIHITVHTHNPVHDHVHKFTKWFSLFAFNQKMWK